MALFKLVSFLLMVGKGLRAGQDPFKCHADVVELAGWGNVEARCCFCLVPSRDLLLRGDSVLSSRNTTLSCQVLYHSEPINVSAKWQTELKAFAWRMLGLQCPRYRSGQVGLYSSISEILLWWTVGFSVCFLLVEGSDFRFWDQQ